MFYYLNGIVAEVQPHLAVIDCGGVGYACATTGHTLAGLKKGEKAKLYTHFHVAENAFGLYGFGSLAELGSFKLLIGVSGVGPKAALAILSVSTPETLTMSVITGDEKALTAAPGIGKKIAQRIILELKDKMSKESAANGFALGTGGGTVSADLTSKTMEAAAALSVLGYSTAETAAALKGVDTQNLPLEEIIRACLKKMAR
ncbi:Holliday junction ATP-dependent DNA helicase RuvA [bioreactor metagenome]|uniref:Holliday junction ATP-dependent DNA helicase RuvA n=1 Tax=bioreactor metagenome TaxID=1076179 RepID=A0A645CBE1_9ZZZZ|nr:Holliday junction branch migration protein RuvA [Oscillibacter sp.]MEA4993347.1 Holliday junction branch migration protein RuvA [Oscillibacter sp.]